MGLEGIEPVNLRIKSPLRYQIAPQAHEVEVVRIELTLFGLKVRCFTA